MMSCAICYTPPQNYQTFTRLICETCLKEAQRLIAISNNAETARSDTPASKSSKGFAGVSNFITEMKEEMKRLKFVSEFVISSFKENIHTDILVNPGKTGTSIPAHRALLATRSDILKNMLESDECKAPASKSITIPEMNHEELESLLEFLYNGSLPTEKIEKHLRAMSLAADKYNIPFLQMFCEIYMLDSLNTSNALDFLELSDACSNCDLRQAILDFILKNTSVIILSNKFDDFALKNPHLCLKITRGIIAGKQR